MDLYQALHNATFQDPALKHHALDLISTVINPTHTPILPPKVNRIIRDLFRNGEVAFNMTQTYRDLDYTITKHAHLAITDDSRALNTPATYLLFTYDDTFYYNSLTDLCRVLELVA